jgi:hypothetical protein
MRQATKRPSVLHSRFSGVRRAGTYDRRVRPFGAIGGLLVAALGLARTRLVEPTLPAAHEAPDLASASAQAQAIEEAVPVPDPPDPPPVGPGAPPSPASRYVSLSGEECLAELDGRHVEYVRVDRPDVETPLRLVGPLSGVRFRTMVPKTERARSLYEIFDCRLVLALDDFARIVRDHGIVDVMYYSAFRPLVPGVVKRGHESALAIDIAFLGRDDGSAYSVRRDFTPITGEHPCAPVIRAKGPREMRAVVCEAVAQRIFHVALTPDYDAAHRDHFHLEIIAGEVRSFAR